MHQPIMSHSIKRDPDELVSSYLLLRLCQHPIEFVPQISVSATALRHTNFSKPGFLFRWINTRVFSLTIPLHVVNVSVNEIVVWLEFCMLMSDMKNGNVILSKRDVESTLMLQYKFVTISIFL